MRMAHTKLDALEALESGVLPITPLRKTFSMTTASRNKITVTRQQLPVMPAYAFADYCSQVQMINYCIIDLGMPPTGQLMPFNAYVALSQAMEETGIRF